MNISLKHWGMASAVLLASASAQASSVWSNASGDNVMTNAANWSGDALSSTVFLDIALADEDRAVLSDGMSLTVYDVRVGVNWESGVTGELDITGGYLRSDRSGGDTRIGYSGRTGIVNQSGGEWEVAQALVVGIGGTGIYNLSGGELDNQRDEFIIDGSDSVMTISGGILKTRFDAAVRNGGTFKVEGTGASSIGIGGSASGNGTLTIQSGAVFCVRIDDTAAGVTKTSVTGDSGDVTFEEGALLDVGFTGAFTNGGTFTVMEWDGAVTNNGLQFADGVDTNIWSFTVDAANRQLTVTAQGDSAAGPDVTLTVGDTPNQMMRYGIDYERLWYWYGDGLDEVPDWSVNDCNVDYIRCAINSGYERDAKGDYDLSAYTDKIIPMMTAMQEANPNIKWFASPRPLDEAYSNKKWEGSSVAWQPYPYWITGASTPTNSNFNFNDLECADYLIRYLILMKSNGFKITYMDLTNEWQSDYSGGRLTQSDARDIAQAFDDYLTNAWEYSECPGVVLEAEDFPLLIAPSSWNYSQGAAWIDSLNTQEKKDAIDIAASHNTDKTGSAQDFADAVAAYCNPGTEIWESEQHGWKGSSSTSEAMSFSYMIETVRAGFTGLSGWLAIGTTDQGHCYLLNNGTTVTRNVKYYMFKKLSNTSNFGYALDIDETDDLTSTMALVRENLLTVWVINTSEDSVLAEFDLGGHEYDGSDITWTRWDEDLSIDGDETSEGIEGTVSDADVSSFTAELAGRAAYCFEIPLVDNEDNFPFVQAENYAAGSGVTDSADSVAFSAAGSEIEFDLDVTRTYAFNIGFRVSSASADIAFDIYDGTNLLASVSQAATGSADDWTTVSVSADLEGGPMDLRIIAAGGGWNLDWIEFEEAAVPESARTLYWSSTAADTDMTQAANWVTNNGSGVYSPATWGLNENDTVYIGHSGANAVEGPVYEASYDGGTAEAQGELYIGYSRSGQLNFNSGALDFDMQNRQVKIGYGTRGHGTLNMNGGSLEGEAFRVGMDRSGCDGVINLTGGALSAARGVTLDGVGVSLSLGESGAYGEMNVSGGSLDFRFGAVLGRNGGTAEFHVEGSDAAQIGFGTKNSGSDGSWIQNSGSTLSAAIDEGGLTPITIEGWGDGGAYAAFETNSFLEVAWAEGVTNYGSFDVMTWEGELTDNGLTFSTNVNTDIWSFAFVDTDGDSTNDTLRVTAVPGTTDNGTPVSWLNAYGLDESDDDVDSDGDGLLSWEEYAAGTDPTNENSVLKVTSLVQDGADYIITWQSVSNRSYSIITNASLTSENSGTAVSGIAGAAGETSVTLSIPSASALYIEVGVE